MYAQFLVDLALLTIAFAMIAGLPSFFHLLLLLVIIPCTILAPFCGMLLASLASGAHLWLVSLMAQPAGWAEIVGPIFIFVMAADQCRFYGRRLAAKTRQAEESTWIAEALLRVAGELTAEPTVPRFSSVSPRWRVSWRALPGPAC